jgi:hypothetical protein
MYAVGYPSQNPNGFGVATLQKAIDSLLQKVTTRCYAARQYQAMNGQNHSLQ